MAEEKEHLEVQSCGRDSILRACQSGTKTEAEIKALSQNCGVPSYGIARVWPLSLVASKQLTCARLLNVDTTKHLSEQLAKSLDAQVLEVMAQLGEKPRVSHARFEGLTEHGIFLMIYLIRRNPDVCVVAPDLRRALESMVSSEITDLQWEDFSIFWGPDPAISDEERQVLGSSHPRLAFKLSVPGQNQERYMSGVVKCLSTKPRAHFFLSLLTLHSFGGSYHANVLFYDQTTGLLERFEPFQAQLPQYKTQDLDRQLGDMFRKAFPDSFKGHVAPPNIDVWERKGLQLQAEAEHLQKRGLDPGGFCLSWSGIYADLRLTLPFQVASTIPEVLELIMRKYGLKWTELIRNYADDLFRLKQELITEMLAQDALARSEGKPVPKDPELQLYVLALRHLSAVAEAYT